MMNRYSYNDKDPRRRGSTECANPVINNSNIRTNVPISQNSTEFPIYVGPPPVIASYENRFPISYPPYPPPSIWPLYSMHPYPSTNLPNFSFPSLPHTPNIPSSNVCSVPFTHAVAHKPIFRENTQLLETKHSRIGDTHGVDFEFCNIEKQFFPNRRENNCNEPQVTLWRASYHFREYYNLLKILENDMVVLKSCCKDESDEKWDHLCQQICEKQEKLKALKDCMKFSRTDLQLLRRKWNKRKKKRNLAKEKRRSKKKVLSKYEIADLHMQQLLRNADKIEQEETLKKEADSVLSSVLQKKNEARNQIQLLTIILKLHSARLHLSNIGDQHSANPSISGFKRIIEKLKTLWEAQVNEYEIEENGLKIMLKESAVNAEDEDCKNLKKTFGRWTKLIFGVTDLQKELFYSDTDQFIKLRQDWDKYVVENPSEGSKIPAGWIVPRYTSNDSWGKFVFH